MMLLSQLSFFTRDNPQNVIFAIAYKGKMHYIIELCVGLNLDFEMSVLRIVKSITNSIRKKQ